MYYTENSNEYNSSKIFQIIISIFITPIRMLPTMNRKTKKFNPLLKLRRGYMVNIASRADSGQWLVHERQIPLSTERA
jgi:hypothetical protein